MKLYYKNKHWKLNEDYDIDKILYLLIDRPTYIDFYNNFYWKNNGNWHRDYDLPACICNNGYISWHTNDVWHRENNKPARMWNDNQKQYWHFGNVIKQENK